MSPLTSVKYSLTIEGAAVFCSAESISLSFLAINIMKILYLHQKNTPFYFLFSISEAFWWCNICWGDVWAFNIFMVCFTYKVLVAKLTNDLLTIFILSKIFNCFFGNVDLPFFIATWLISSFRPASLSYQNKLLCLTELLNLLLYSHFLWISPAFNKSDSFAWL